MRGRSVLVVDDEKNVLKAWCRALRFAGYAVRMAETSEEALQECNERHFDLVVVDFLMPAMTGVELLARIRKRLPFVRSIIVSGKIDDNITEDAIGSRLRERIEADLYLHKPVSNERLLESVKRLLEADAMAASWEVVAKRAREVGRASIASARQASKDLKKLRKGRRKR